MLRCEHSANSPNSVATSSETGWASASGFCARQSVPKPEIPLGSLGLERFQGLWQMGTIGSEGTVWAGRGDRPSGTQGNLVKGDGLLGAIG